MTLYGAAHGPEGVETGDGLGSGVTVEGRGAGDGTGVERRGAGDGPGVAGALAAQALEPKLRDATIASQEKSIVS